MNIYFFNVSAVIEDNLKMEMQECANRLKENILFCGFKENELIFYNETDIKEYLDEHKEFIINNRRWLGCAIWKPKYIDYLLNNKLEENDLLLYCDTSFAFIGNVRNFFIDFMKQYDHDIFVLENGYKNKQLTKRDVFIKMDCDEDKYINGDMCMTGLLCLKNNKSTRKLIKEWYNYCLDYTIVDNVNRIELKQDKEYKSEQPYGNMPEQSVFSLLCIKYDIPYINYLTRNYVFFKNKYKFDYRFHLNRTYHGCDFLRKCKLLNLYYKYLSSQNSKSISTYAVYNIK